MRRTKRKIAKKAFGCGAHLITSAPNMYRVYLRASPETCVERIAAREHKDLIWAQHERRRVEHERRRFLERLFGRKTDAFDDFDLVLNTDHIKAFESCVDVILAGLRAPGLHTGRP